MFGPALRRAAYRVDKGDAQLPFLGEDMKTIFRHTLTMALLLGAAFYALSTDAAAQAATYPLVCRGDRHALIEAIDDPQGVSLKFKKGTAAFGPATAPGECSWLDRGMNAAEADILVQPGLALADVWFSVEDKWTADLKDPDKYWTFDVYSDKKGRLIVTDSRKGRPVTVATPLGAGVDVEAAKALAKAPKAPLYFLGKGFGGGVFGPAALYDCFYTASVEEKGYAAGLGFSFRAVVGYVLKTQLPGTVPLHRLFKDHDHFLTTDEEEKGYAKGLGYDYEGVLGYVSKRPLPGTTPLYRFYLEHHCYVTGESEKKKQEQFTRLERIEAYVWTSP